MKRILFLVAACFALAGQADIHICNPPGSGGGGGGGGTWGSITGTLSSQTDLQTALNAKPSSTATTDLAIIRANGTGGNIKGSSLKIDTLDGNDAFVFDDGHNIGMSGTTNSLVISVDAATGKTGTPTLYLLAGGDAAAWGTSASLGGLHMNKSTWNTNALSTSADNTALTPLGVYNRIFSDDATPANRTITITNGKADGDLMLLELWSGAIQLNHGGNMNLCAGVAWEPTVSGKMKMFVWNIGAGEWREWPCT